MFKAKKNQKSQKPELNPKKTKQISGSSFFRIFFYFLFINYIYIY